MLVRVSQKLKKTGLFIFIKYLTQHIPDKNFRQVRGYGLFCNRNKSDAIEIVLKLLKKKKKLKVNKKAWRENLAKLLGNDPLTCDNCGIEMEFWFARYGPDEQSLVKFGLKKQDRIPVKQFALKSA